MHLTHLSLTDFRAFARLDLSIPRGNCLLVGSNAQGKTSVLEAIYYFATFDSFSAPNDRQLVNLLAAREKLAVGRLVAQFERKDGAHKMEIRLILEPSGNGSARLRKEILVDGVKRKEAQALGQFNAVIFLPQMTRIIEEGPEERRRYLNLTLSQVMPGYAQALGEYQNVLTQRNALLKQLGERGGSESQLEPWDELLAKHGALLIFARIQAIEELERIAARVHTQLTRQAEVLRLLYQPSYEPLLKPDGQFALPLQTTAQRTGVPQDRIRQGFLEKLNQVRADEINRGVTTLGPHRDELRFIANGIDLGDYGSRGQIRTTLLSLKLAEVDWVKQKTGEWPVLLLDETLAELDGERRADLMQVLIQSEQALLTTTDLSQFPADFTAACRIWHVDSGQIIEP
jgi:DNA replication and repair protein RecF